MADKQIDSSQHQGLKGFSDRYFGYDERFVSLSDNAKAGFKKGVGLGSKSPWVGLALMALVTEVGSFAVTDVQDLDWGSDATITQMQGENIAYHPFTVSGEDGGAYMILRDSNDAYRLYNIEGAGNDADDRLVYEPSQSEAWQVASDMARYYSDAMEDVSQGLMPDNMPKILAYEGISQAFQSEADPDVVFRVGDEPTESNNISITTADIDKLHQFWLEAARSIGEGNYADAPDTMLKNDIELRVGLLDWLQNWALLMAIGVGATGGLGASLGAASSMRSSRRRYKRQNGLEI